ncbi:hypothetical protein [Methylorubrum extorquens]|uniref:hypothetical protein n=1 Tax=Methylorubrum extorquens TaxID=408 RepID=UPI000158F1A3|nr:hypothetical protein [Methylorubrum extorquens]ABY32754.1 hypothetical protein Mext_4385 [Methylorubrum extorquens PA1]KQP95550.1 hypothetical protein ASF55_00030 [Methylobacterium sp. Leaf119]
MTDLSQTIAPKSDQLNADDLIGGPRTIRVTGVSKMREPDQPIAINFEGDGGKPYKPGKSMRRVLVRVWGNDGTTYVGRRMTLYRDDAVQFGGVAVGGIRISHMSDITSAVTMALTVTRANRKPFTVKPLLAEQRRDSDKPAGSSNKAEPSQEGSKQQTGRDRLYAAAREAAGKGSAALADFRAALTDQQDRALDPILAELDRTAERADETDESPADDGDRFPGDDELAARGEAV